MPCWDPLQFTPGLAGRDPRPATQREISDQQPATASYPCRQALPGSAPHLYSLGHQLVTSIKFV